MKARLRSGMATAACVALLAAPAPGLGEAWRYGGTREDALREIVAAPGGYLAAGTTASSDGDLAARTRRTSTGWAAFIGEDGEAAWNFCTGRSGMDALSAPVALDGGGYSLVLRGEDGQRGEWITLDERGRVKSRVAVPAPDALMGDGIHRTLAAMAVVQTAAGPQLMALLSDGAGALTPVLLDVRGKTTVGQRFLGAPDGILAANASGECAWVSAQDGGIAIDRMSGPDDLRAQSVCVADAPAQSVCDALMQEDGSVTLAVAGEAGGALVRVSAAGDVLFAHAMPKAPTHICQTGTGFAAYAQGSVSFLDEDGALLDAQDGLPQGALDIVGTPGGAALLLREGEAKGREAVLRAVPQRAFAAREDEPEGTQVEPAERAEPAAQDEPAAQAAPAAQSGMERGQVQCENVPGGVRVTCVDASGARVFETKIPIQTAADALVWQCALPLEDGGVALGGCYVYGTGEDARCAGAVALLDGAGVLRRMQEIEEVGCVLAIAPGAGGMLEMDVATQKRVGAQADGKITFAP